MGRRQSESGRPPVLSGHPGQALPSLVWVQCLRTYDEMIAITVLGAS